MRIVAGKYRGRHFDVPRSFKARPTTDFAKENLFNVLRGYLNDENGKLQRCCSIENTKDEDEDENGEWGMADVEWRMRKCLDLFAGTGSITLELLSRGCESVTAVELDPQHVRLIRSFVHTLGEDQRAHVVRADVLRYLSKAVSHGPFSFIFADPPYALPQIPDLPDTILGVPGLLSADGLLVLEHGSANDFSSHPAIVDHRAYGSVNFSFFKC